VKVAGAAVAALAFSLAGAGGALADDFGGGVDVNANPWMPPVPPPPAVNASDSAGMGVNTPVGGAGVAGGGNMDAAPPIWMPPAPSATGGFGFGFGG
jgi:hypothetical protein